MFYDYYEDEAVTDRPYFLQCQKCAMYFNAYDLTEVLYHEFDHADRDSDSKEEETMICGFCGSKRFEARERKGVLLGFECEQCGMLKPSREQKAA